MRILLINPPGWQKESINVGLSYLAAAVLKEGHGVKIFDINISNQPPQVVADRVKEFSPQVIGFSVKTATVQPACIISRSIKKVYNKAIHVAGGPHISLAYEEFLRENHEFDYAFIGESDISFPDFIKKVNSNKELSGISGICYRNKDKIVATEKEIISDLDSLPFPNFNVIDTFQPDRFRYPLITSRGCPYSCIYCCVSLISSKKWRARSVENILKELKHAKERYNIGNFEILDDNFTLHLNRAKEFCRQLKSEKFNFTWYCHNGIRADKLDWELAKLMKRSGCTSVAIGVESGDKKIFNSIKKGEKLSHIVQAVHLIKKAGMRTVGYFIIGLPGDDLNGTLKTIKFQQFLGLDDFTYGILTPYPGTEVWSIIKEKGKILVDIKDVYHFSDKLTVPIEYPGFSSSQIEEAYYLATYWNLHAIKERFEQKFKKKDKKILYINFSLNSGFLDTLKKVWGENTLDVFSSQYRYDWYLSNKLNKGISRIYVYKEQHGILKKILSFLKFSYMFRKEKYDFVFYNSSTRKLLLPAILLITKPKYLFLEEQQGKCIYSVYNRKVLEFIISQLKNRLLYGLVSILLYPFFRLVVLVFGVFLFFKRDRHLYLPYLKVKTPIQVSVPLKILHLCDHYRAIGGAEKLLFDMLMMLEGAGVKNVIVMHDYPENKCLNVRSEYIVSGLDVQPTTNNLLSYISKSLSAKKTLHKIILKEKPDLIHIHNIQNPFTIAEAIKMAPTVRSNHDPRLYCFTDWRLLPVSKDICPYPLGYRCITEGCIGKELLKFSINGKKAIPRYASYLLHRKINKLILESQAMITCALQNGYRKEQIELLPNFTTTYELNEVMERNKRFNQPDKNVIVFVGRASYEKGIEYLLQAVYLLKIPFNLYLVTGGPEVVNIYEKVKELKLEDKVEILGPLSYEKTRDYYNMADLIVVPSVWIESFCLVGIEAMANAKPVVAFKTGGIPDWLVDGETGFLAELKNVNDLAEKMKRLLTDKKLANKYGLKGYERVKEKYSKDVYLPKLMKIYKSVTESGKAV